MMAHRSSLWLWTCLLAVLPPHLFAAQANENAFDAHWRSELVRLQGWPAQARLNGDVLVFATERASSCQMRYRKGPAGSQLPPVLYLLDRDAADAFSPASSHSSAILDVRAVLSASGTSPEAPNAEQLPFHEAVLTAVRALDALVGQQAGRTTRAALVGEGYGAAVALALAALRPDAVAFVCAHEPVDPVSTSPSKDGRERSVFARWRAQALEAAQLVSLTRFAPLVKAPTFITMGEEDETATPDQVAAIHAALRCQSVLTPMRRARHCRPQDLREWQTLWREWTRTALGYQ